MINQQRRSYLRGATLVELLVVIAILTVLMSVAIPLMKPAFKDRKLREASRQVNAFFARAKARSAELGRGVGVWIERKDGEEIGSRHALRMYLAEVAPPFSGADVSSRAWIDPTPAVPPSTYWLMLSPLDSSVLNTLISPGETFSIKFDYRGQEYLGTRISSPPGPTQQYQVILPQGPPPGTEVASGLPFQIVRGPVRSSATPLEMPGDTVIDLAVSGVGASGFEFDSIMNPPAQTPPPYNDSPVIIMFAPSGAVDFVFVNNLSFRPQGTIHLLLGRNVNVVNPATANFASTPTNLGDPTALWVSIGHKSGYVTSAENADTSALGPMVPVAQRITAARDIARSSIRMGGR